MKLTSTRGRAAITATILTVAALTLVGCSDGGSSSDSSTGGAGLADGFGSRATNRAVDFFTYYDPTGDAFWNQIQTGAQDAGKLGNLDVTYQTAKGDSSTMVNLVQAAIATKPAMIFMPFNEGQAWSKVACAAHDAGIPVIAYNVPPASDAAQCVLAFVGQDFYAVGQIVAKDALDTGTIKPGDTVEITAEEPGQPYALQRGGGVSDTLKAAGVNVIDKADWLRTGNDDAGALDSLTSYLVAHPEVNAIVPVGGTPHRNLPAALKAAGRTDVKVIGFDTSPQVVQGLKDGVLTATADQQGYVQGFQSVMQGSLYLDFGFSPATINSGGNGLITKDNVANIEAPDLKGVRY